MEKKIEQKTCIITGATSGIGYHTACAIARSGASVVIIARNPEKTEKAVQAIERETGNQNISSVLADLSVQQEIHAAAQQILAHHKSIDILINNAGIWLSKYSETEDGIETMLAVNHLSYFLLSHLLLGKLAASGSGRIINVASDSHFQGRMHFDDLNLQKNYHGLRAYAQSKLANVLFTYELDRRLQEKGMHTAVNCVQPGLVKTDIGVKHTISLHALAWKIRRLSGVSPEEGARTSVYLAESPEVEGVSGKYWDKCKPKKSSKRSYSVEDAKRLWKISLDMCKITDYFAKVRRDRDTP